MKKLYSIMVISCLLFLSILSFSGCLEEKKQTNEENSLVSIQNLINAASTGDTITIPNGEFYENIVINKSINLIGQNIGFTIIIGSVEISSDNVTLSDFTIKNGSGISIVGSSRIIVTNNIIEKSTEKGIYIINSSNNTIFKNIIKDNPVGIYIENSDNNTIYYNNFINNTENAFDGGDNFWYYETSGNYWSDYEDKYPYASIIGGIWNIPYTIPGILINLKNDSFPYAEIINEKPEVNFSFSPTNPTTLDNIQFTDKSEDTDGCIIAWLWDFGDNVTSREKNPLHNYSENGNYVVSLTVTDNLVGTNIKSSFIKVINIEPTADFTIDPINPTDLDNISFIDDSTDSDGVIVSWYWDFGDEEVSNQYNASHIYADDGTYTVTLTVTDDDGAVNTIMKNIDIANVKPYASFSYEPSNPTINDTIYFTATSNDPDGKIVSWNWDLGYGSTSSEQNFSHKFDEGKLYRVTLTVTDDDGVSNSITRDIRVAAPDMSTNNENKGYIILFILFFIVFIIMIIFVYYLYKKYKE